MRSLQYLNRFPFHIMHHLWLLSIFSFYFVFQQFDYDVTEWLSFGFTLSGIHCNSVCAVCSITPNSLQPHKL